MAESIDEEMEAMLLLEGNEGKRMEEMQAQIAGLTQQVRQLAERQAPQSQSVVPSDQPSTSFQDALRQVRTGEVPRNVEMAEFDPIAAARGNHSSDSTAQVRRNILPQRRPIPSLQREQPPREPPRPPGFPSTTLRQNSQGRNVTVNSETALTNVMCSAFTAMALPDVPVFDSAQGKGFDKFLRSFMIKYGGLSLGDDMLIHLLCSKLAGQPRIVAETLPLEVREGTFQEFVAALKTKFKENESANRMEAYISLKNILYSGSISEYCVRLEQLTRAAYPESSERELSILRTGELIAQLTDWPEYVQLFTEVEQTPAEEAYEKLKALAQRIERSREVALHVKQEATNKSAQLPRGQQTPLKREHMSQTKVEREHQEHAEQANLRKNTQQDELKDRELLCYNCKKPGHYKRDCREASGTQYTPRGLGEVSQGGKGNATNDSNAGSFSTVLRHWACSTVARRKANDLVGIQTLETVKFLGLKREALVDSGSQISIMPLDLLLTAQQRGFDIDGDVEHIPRQEYPPVYDASGNLMRFKGAIRLTLEIHNGPRRRAAFFVRKGGDNRVVLGTNIMHALGYSIRRGGQPCKGVRKPPDQRGGWHRKCTENPGKVTELRQAKVAACAYNRPGGSKGLEPTRQTERTQMLRSSVALVPGSLCNTANDAVRSPVTNILAPRIYRVGKVVGRTTSNPPRRVPRPLQRLRENKNETVPKQKFSFANSRVNERPLTSGDRVDVKVPAEKSPSKQPKLDVRTAPSRVSESGESSSSSIRQMKANDKPERVPDQLSKPQNVDNKPIRATKGKSKRGRLRKVTSSNSEVSCCRVEVGEPMDLLNCLHPCECGICEERANRALAGYDAKEMDHHGSMEDAITKLHPATHLGLREAASNFPTFELRSREKKEMGTDQGNDEGMNGRRLPKPKFTHVREMTMRLEQAALGTRRTGLSTSLRRRLSSRSGV